MWPRLFGIPDCAFSKTLSILLLGETGGGKTTVMYSIRDYLEKKDWKKIQFTEDEEAERRDPGQEPPAEGDSRTQTIVELTCAEYEGHRVVIYDTPGVGDTKGQKCDKENWKRLEQYIQELEFNAIILVIKNTDNRKSTRLEYIVQQFKNNFPMQWDDNLMVCVTNCSDNRPSHEVVALLDHLDVDVRKIFSLDNCFYMAQYLSPTLIGEDDELEETINIVKDSRYKRNHKQIAAALQQALNQPKFQGKTLKTRREVKKIENEISIYEKRKRMLKGQKTTNTLPEIDTTPLNNILQYEVSSTDLGHVKDQFQIICARCPTNKAFHSFCECEDFLNDHTYLHFRKINWSELSGFTISGGAGGGVAVKGGIALAIKFGIITTTVANTPFVIAGVALGGLFTYACTHQLETCNQCKHDKTKHIVTKRFLNKKKIRLEELNLKDIDEILAYKTQLKDELQTQIKK